jgi:succinylglutamic semialdehyde dehydrogenase
MIALSSVLNSEVQFKGSFVNGEWRKEKKASFSWSIQSPANVEWQLPELSAHFDFVDESVEFARKAYGPWRDLSMDDRARVLLKFGEELLKRKENIARVMAVETGKPLDECLVEAQVLKTKIDITLEDGRHLVASQKLDLGKAGRGEIHYRPKGVLAVIGPFNFPTHLSNGHIIPALLMGNVCILKPSEKTPYSAQAYMEAAEAAGFPAGVLQMLQGHGELASRLVGASGIDGVLATTSYEIGAKIQSKLAANTEKIVALEMGGKNAAIVWENTDPKLVAQHLINSSFLTTGQRCTALSRVYVHPSVKEALIAELHDLAKELIINHPFAEEPKPFMGPIISAASRDKFLRYSDIATSEGAECIMRPKILDGIPKQSRTPLPEGYYVSPSIHYVKEASAESVYQNHEIFGPDIFFCEVTDLDEAIHHVNSTQYGLSFSFFGGDEAKFGYVADRVECGLTYWNRPTTGASSKLPFGGWKRSGNHWPAGLFAIYASSQVQTRLMPQE